MNSGINVSVNPSPKRANATFEGPTDWSRCHSSRIRIDGTAATIRSGIGLLLPMPLLIVAAVPSILILLLWQRDQSVGPSNVAFALFGLGFTLTLIPEFIYLIDIFNS